MYISLYRRYRPQTFSEIVGQDAVVAVLRKSLKEGKVAHAYLFSGPRGCGKTTVARLVAKALNCEHPSAEMEPCEECENCRAITSGDHLDVIEIDAASNRGIDEVRELKAHVVLSPFKARYKVYIIDEVHMLTEQAFNALLKTLEEPPESVVFLLATTEPQKVPVTIRSRCQHLPFHRIPIEGIAERLREVAGKEGHEVEEEALWELARLSDGALRDALSFLEQAMALSGGLISMETFKQLLGGGSRPELELWLSTLRNAPQRALADLRKMIDSGVSNERLLEGLFLLFRDLWVFCRWGEEGVSALSLTEKERDFLKEEAPHWSASALREACAACSRLLAKAHSLRSDVFLGYLMEELSGILLEDEEKGTPIQTSNLLACQECSISNRIDKTAEVDSIQSHLEKIPSQEPNVRNQTTKEGSMLESTLRENPFLYACLLESRIVDKEDRIEVVLPPKAYLEEAFLKTTRTSQDLKDLLASQCPERSVFVLIRGETVIPLGEDPNEAPNVPQKTPPPFSSSEKNEKPDYSQPSGNDEKEESEGLKMRLTRIQRWLDAEVLLIKEQESAELTGHEVEGEPEA